MNFYLPEMNYFPTILPLFFFLKHDDQPSSGKPGRTLVGAAETSIETHSCPQQNSPVITK